MQYRAFSLSCSINTSPTTERNSEVINQLRVVFIAGDRLHTTIEHCMLCASSQINWRIVTDYEINIPNSVFRLLRYTLKSNIYYLS